MARVVPKEVDDKVKREVGARDGGCDAGAGYAEGRESEFTEDKEVIPEDVDEVCCDESEGDRAHHVHTLEGAADGEVEKEGKKPGGESAHIGSGENRNVVGDAEAFEVERDEPDRKGQERSDREAEVNAVEERAVAVFAASGSEGLRDESVEADQEAFTKKGEDQEEAGADTDGSDGLGAVGEPADHHSVNDDHAHPTDFGEDEWEGEAERGAEFGTKGVKEGHREQER